MAKKRAAIPDSGPDRTRIYLGPTPIDFEVERKPGSKFAKVRVTFGIAMTTEGEVLVEELDRLAEVLGR